jgi:hypothetical protein
MENLRSQLRGPTTLIDGESSFLFHEKATFGVVLDNIGSSNTLQIPLFNIKNDEKHCM